MIRTRKVQDGTGQVDRPFVGWHQVSQNPMKFRPLLDRVVVRRLNAEEKTVGGIIIPDTAQEKPSVRAPETSKATSSPSR